MVPKFRDRSQGGGMEDNTSSSCHASLQVIWATTGLLMAPEAG